MDCLLTEDQRLIRDGTREFATGEVKPLAKKIDHEHYFPEELIPKFAEMGFLGVYAPENLGGAGLDYVSYFLISEEISVACATSSVIIGAHNSLCLWPILNFGTEEQKKKCVPELTSGEALGCFALSEPSTGSDAARLRCMVKKKGDKWIVNGSKNWITNGPVAKYCILFAMEEPEKGHKGIKAFIADLTKPGCERGKKEDKLGICGSPTCSLMFTDFELTDADLLQGDAFKIAMKTLDGGRIGICGQATGISQAALNDAVQYSKERETFGVPIHQHQSIQNYLADMSKDTEAGRLLGYLASVLKDKGLPYTAEAARAKLFASEAAVRNALLCIQIHGGYGYVKEYNAERYLRDAKITEIYEGTSEIQRLVIASSLLR